MIPPLTRDSIAAMVRDLTPDLTPEGRLKTALATALLAAWDERDRLQKEFDAVVATLSEMHGAEYSRAEAAETKLAERDAENARLRDGLRALEKTATETIRLGAVTGGHWSRITVANLKVRALLAELGDKS